MADGGEVKIKITGDDNDFSRKMGNVGSVAKKALGVAGTAVGAAATALTAAGAAAFKFGSDFETSLAKVSTIADTSKVSMQQINSGILELSNSTGLAATELGEATYQAISASVDSAQAVNFVGQAAKLAKGGFTDTATAVDTLTTVLNAYGLEATEATRISDILIQTQNKGKTTVNELSAVMGRVIPTAAAFGVSIENLGTAFQITTANGIRTAESGTYISGMLNELGKSGTKVSDVLKSQTGQSFTQLMEGGASLGDVLGILNNYAQQSGLSLADLFGSAEAGKAAMSIAQAGTEAFNTALADTQNAAGTTEEAFKKMDSTTGASIEKIGNNFRNLGIQIYQTADGAISEVVGLFSDMSSRLSDAFNEGGLTGIVSEFGNVLGELVTYIVSRAPDMVNAAVGLIQSFVQGISSNSGEIATGASQMITVLVQGIATLAPTLLMTAIALIVQFSNGLIQQMPMLASTGAQMVINLVMGLAQQLPSIISAAFGLIVALVQGLQSSAQMIMAAGPEIIQNLVQGLVESIPDILGAALQIVATILNTFLSTDWLALGWEIIKGIGNGLKNGITNIFSGGKEAGKGAADGASAGLEEGKGGVTLAASDTAQSTLSAFMPMTNTAGIGSQASSNLAGGINAGEVSDSADDAAQSGIEAFNRIMQTAGIGSQASSNLAGGLSAGGGEVSGAATGVADEAINSFNTSIMQMPETANTATQQTVQAVTTGLSQLPSIATTNVTSMNNAFTSGTAQSQAIFSTSMAQIRSIVSRTDLYSVGANMIQGLINGMRSKLGEVQAVASQIAAIAAQAAKVQLQIHSPSKVFYEIGENVILGLANGLTDNARTAVLAMREVNERLLKSEELFNKEKQRLEDEAFDKEYEKKLAEAKDAEEAEKIKQEYILDAEKEGQDKYLELLEERAEKQRDLYDEAIKAISDGRKDIIKELGKDEQLYRLTGANYGEITDLEGNIISPSFEVREGALADLKPQIERIEEYENAILKLKSIKNVPKEFFDKIKEMSMEEGQYFAEAMINASPEELQEYIDDWYKLEGAKNRISEELYRDDTNALAKAVMEEFGDVPDAFYGFGKDSASEFGDGFMDRLRDVMSTIQSEIQSQIAVAVPSMQAAGGGNTYNATYYVQPAQGESTQAQLLAIRAAEKVNQHRMG